MKHALNVHQLGSTWDVTTFEKMHVILVTWAANEGLKRSCAPSVPPARVQPVDVTFSAWTERNWKLKPLSLVLRNPMELAQSLVF